jgi:hypothetical protein
MPAASTSIGSASAATAPARPPTRRPARRPARLPLRRPRGAPSLRVTDTGADGQRVANDSRRSRMTRTRSWNGSNAEASGLVVRSRPTLPPPRPTRPRPSPPHDIPESATHTPQSVRVGMPAAAAAATAAVSPDQGDVSAADAPTSGRLPVLTREAFTGLVVVGIRTGVHL